MRFGWLGMTAMLVLGHSSPVWAAGNVAEGQRLYAKICAFCHGATPEQVGKVGPAVRGASREMLEARVLRGEYPPMAFPQRDTKLMPTFPSLKDKIDDLTAYLNADTGASASTAQPVAPGAKKTKTPAAK